MVTAASVGCARTGRAPQSATAPDSFAVTFVTSKGPVIAMFHRSWSPRGVDRVYALLSRHFYDDARFFRVVPHFVAQFGLPAQAGALGPLADTRIDDDSVRVSNLRGRVAMASAGPNSRTSQLFFNLHDNPRLDVLNGGYPPLGEVVAGIAVLDSLDAEYEDAPDQDSLRRLGNGYLLRAFPRLDYIRTARVSNQW